MRRWKILHWMTASIPWLTCCYLLSSWMHIGLLLSWPAQHLTLPSANIYITRCSQRVMNPIFCISCSLQVGHVKISQNFPGGKVIFKAQYPSLLTMFIYLWKEQIFLLGKRCSPSPTATGSQQSAMPHDWHNSVLKGFLLEEPNTLYNLMVWGQDCRVDVATVFVQNLWWSL